MYLNRPYKKGFSLIEATLSGVLIIGAISLRTHFDAREMDLNKSKDFAQQITKVVYAMDKRILLDGVTMDPSIVGTETGASDSWDKLQELFIGVDHPQCGVPSGWSPSDDANKPMALIGCNEFLPGRMPFKMEMDVTLNSTPSGAFQSFVVDFYHDDADEFKKHFSRYATIKQTAVIKDRPQITGSHRYSIVDRTSGDEISPLECLRIETDCAIRAEHFTNHSGLGEDVYLRVGGQNMMQASIRFKGTSHNAAVCKVMKTPGVMEDSTCGITFDSTTDKLGVNAHVVTASKFEFVNNDGTLIAKCRDELGAEVVCGASTVDSGVEEGKTILRLNKLVAEAITVAGDFTVVDPADAYSQKFKIQANGKAYSRLDEVAGKSPAHMFAYGIKSENGNNELTIDDNGVILGNNDNSVLIDSSGTTIKGALPVHEPIPTEQLDSFNVNVGGAQNLGEFVTKSYLHSFYQLASIERSQSNVSKRILNCPDGNPSKIIGFPADTMMVESYSQKEAVCPYQIGQRIPKLDVTTRVPVFEPTRIQVVTNIKQTTTCRLDGDYLQVWYFQESGVAGARKYTPRFFLVGPKKSGRTTNVEVIIAFNVFQYCPSIAPPPPKVP
ncbi:hypothetical protein [Vibrio alginolyticus]|uniref:hypothetical protein n=1 Tax=Vibrio alginolyticus TaxID=663 RepID=UPI0006CA7EFA|nr:hypothetical protein [Vibrio alginolyticus]KPM98518.1 hypothetical protein AOG25_08725 [Vibrio alginolyticus]CAH7147857.1 conserved hypothetical protein [Vibrio chagasii]CAH7318636.1 conserved hypothetical protein [Vibrio chagasii]